jgi:acyl carrier protein
LTGQLGLTHIAVFCLEKPDSRQDLAGLPQLTKLVVLHVEEAAFASSGRGGREGSQLIRTALAAVREMMPPLAAVIYPAASTPLPPPATAARTLQQQAAAPVITLSGPPAAAAASQREHERSTQSMQQAILSAVEDVAGMEAVQRVAAGEPLMAAGVSSTLAVQLTNALEASLGKQLPGTLVFDYPSLQEMSKFLAAEMGGTAAATAAAATTLQQAEPGLQRRQLPAAAASVQRGVLAPRPGQHPRAPASARQQAQQDLLQLVLSTVQEVAGGSAGEVGGDTPLMVAGVTSTLAVQLVSSLESALGIELPGTLVFDYPTAQEIAEFVSASQPQQQGGLALHAQQAATAGGGDGASAAREALVSLILQAVCEVSDSVDAGLGPDTPLMSAGIPSALAVQVVSALESAVGTELPGTLVFDYPSVNEIAEYLLHSAPGPSASLLAAAAAAATRPLVPALLPDAGQHQAAAVKVITAAAHKVPGGSLHYTPAQGNDRIGLVPLERWDTDTPPPDVPSGVAFVAGN